jgi:hypothetical protein
MDIFYFFYYSKIMITLHGEKTKNYHLLRLLWKQTTIKYYWQRFVKGKKRLLI